MGGLIVTPYRGLALLRLVAADDGRTASGPVVDAMSFMVLRGQREADAVDMRPVINSTLAEAEKVRTDTDLTPLESDHGAEFLFHVLVPTTRISFGEKTWWFEAQDDSAWAAWKPGKGQGR
ncbi:hypothetical protein [Streptomyces syringium]|uniref:Uncharacterized protein n=1 Tax=Streptomyces syringium TaxID=76729 RepID=A0ABS4XWA5_9ACTN|nr:hypothetical protein [Streptomyces syringium]MBP2400787.1 hypothetical protein [Streptomyces syringium]